MDTVVLSLLCALILMVVRVLVELIKFRGTAEALLARHTETLKSLEIVIDNLECRQVRKPACAEQRVSL